MYVVGCSCGYPRGPEEGRGRRDVYGIVISGEIQQNLSVVTVVDPGGSKGSKDPPSARPFMIKLT